MQPELFKDLLLLIRYEIIQRREEGCEVKKLEEQFEEVTRRPPGKAEIDLLTILHDLEMLQPTPSFPYLEPSTLDEIRALRPDGPRRLSLNMTDDQLFNRIYGAWLGRAAGCALGKPVEGWQKVQINSYLQFTRALPLNDYIPLMDGHPDGLKLRFPECTRGNISCMARDDDMDYTVLGLDILETYGLDYTSRNVGEAWLNRLPYHLVYTAEKAAYRNLVNHIWPPESATYRNPFREWIGAQIRADIWGYVTPGWPEKAAEFAFRDAAVSHVKNGIYGEMFIAAMLSAAFVSDGVEEAINIGLSEIPRNCRLAEAIKNTVKWSKETPDWEQVWDKINAIYGHYHMIHTINNAALVIMALLMARLNFEKGIVVAVRGGWDTDCNGATVGSIMGTILGAQALPQKWTGVLHDRLLSAVIGFNDSKISDLAKRTIKIVNSHFN